MDLEFPQRLTPLSTCAASQHPSHVSTARLCLPHTQKQVHEHKPQACGRPASMPPWKGCWKVPGPALACTEKGLRAQRGEDPSPRSHSTSGAGPGIKPRSLFSCPVLLSLCSSWPLSPAPSPCLHHVSWGRGLKGMDVGGSSYPQRPLPAPSCSSSHCHLLANGTRQLQPDPQFRRGAA